jgi:hypothetical protein
MHAAGVRFTLLRNGWYTENYTDQLDQYLQRGEIFVAAGSGRISAATLQDYARAAVTALLQDDGTGPTSSAAQISTSPSSPRSSLGSPARRSSTPTCQSTTTAPASSRPASTRRTRGSSPPSTPRSRMVTSRPTARIWRGCWVTVPHPSPTSSARPEAVRSRDPCENRDDGKRFASDALTGYERAGERDALLAGRLRRRWLIGSEMVSSRQPPARCRQSSAWLAARSRSSRFSRSS